MRRYQSIQAAVIFSLLIVSCGPQKKGLFGDNRSPHQQYGDRIKESGLDKTQLGSRWFAAADKSIAQPLNITLPYREAGYFAADKPSAAGFLFNARRGDRISMTVTTIPSTAIFFAELWKYDARVKKSDLLATADSTLHIVHDIENAGPFFVRLQPELLQGVEYEVTITAGPSLAFPVSNEGGPKLISFWDAPRDGGVRSHEGVDISARFRTPVLAGADGRVHLVSENRLGGKVVFMRPKGKKYSLYYAHLDSQIVATGDEVKAGQPLGLVGNTGNARNTVPHLHFGIYSTGGAVDPLPFIDIRREKPRAVTASLERIKRWTRTSAKTKIYSSPHNEDTSYFDLPAGAAVNVIAAAANWYKVRLPDDREGYLRSTAVTDRSLTTLVTDSVTRLLDHPIQGAAAFQVVEEKTRLEVVGTFGDYYLIRHRDSFGWIPALQTNDQIGGRIQRL